MKNKLVYIYSELPSYVRVEKNIKVFLNHFDEVHFIGVNRNGQKELPQSNIEGLYFHILDSTIPHGGLRSILKSFQFVLFAREILKDINADVIVLANEESYAPLLFSSKLTKNKVIVCELLDSLAIRLTGYLKVLNPVVRPFSRFVTSKAHYVVEVTESRLLRHGAALDGKSFVIHNSPDSQNMDSISLTKEVESKLPKSEPYIYVSGSVVPNVSGIEELLMAVHKVNDYSESKGESKVKIVYSGRLTGEWATNKFFSNPDVINFGCLTPSESLLVANKSLAMYAYYRPINNNYIYAAPNKVYDAVSIQKYILMNDECKAASIPGELGLLLSSPYGSVDGIVSNIMKLFSNNEITLDNKLSIQKEFDEKYAWPVMEKRWAALFRLAKDKLKEAG